jgi:hypothetical protein
MHAMPRTRTRLLMVTEARLAKKHFPARKSAKIQPLKAGLKTLFSQPLKVGLQAQPLKQGPLSIYRVGVGDEGGLSSRAARVSG